MSSTSLQWEGWEFCAFCSSFGYLTREGCTTNHLNLKPDRLKPLEQKDSGSHMRSGVVRVWVGCMAAIRLSNDSLQSTLVTYSPSVSTAVVVLDALLYPACHVTGAV